VGQCGQKTPTSGLDGGCLVSLSTRVVQEDYAEVVFRMTDDDRKGTWAKMGGKKCVGLEAANRGGRKDVDGPRFHAVLEAVRNNTAAVSPNLCNADLYCD
jgi:hypothetical protein